MSHCIVRACLTPHNFRNAVEVKVDIIRYIHCLRFCYLVLFSCEQLLLSLEEIRAVELLLPSSKEHTFLRGRIINIIISLAVKCRINMHTK